MSHAQLRSLLRCQLCDGAFADFRLTLRLRLALLALIIAPPVSLPPFLRPIRNCAPAGFQFAATVTRKTDHGLVEA